MSHVRAAVITAPGVVEMEHMQVSGPGPGQVRIAVEGCGVCGSNIPVWSGRPWFRYPLAPGAPGHEGWGKVDRVGDGIDDLAVGSPVAFLSDNAFADSVVVSRDKVVGLPEKLDGAIFPGESLGSAFNIARRSHFAAGQDVAIVGIGFIGALLVALASDAGANVTAISRSESSLQVARAMGATNVVESTELSLVVGAVNDITTGRLCDVVIEAVGVQDPLTLAAQLTKARGRLVIAGYHQDGLREVDLQLWNWRGIDVINAHERDQDVVLEGIALAVEAISEGRLDPSSLYTNMFPLERTAAALDAVTHQEAGFMKAVVLT